MLKSHRAPPLQLPIPRSEMKPSPLPGARYFPFSPTNTPLSAKHGDAPVAVFWQPFSVPPLPLCPLIIHNSPRTQRRVARVWRCTDATHHFLDAASLLSVLTPLTFPHPCMGCTPCNSWREYMELALYRKWIEKESFLLASNLYIWTRFVFTIKI